MDATMQVQIRINEEERSAEVDFTGTSAQLTTNFNAPSAVVRAAVMYVFRTLVDDEIPMNEGCLKVGPVFSYLFLICFCFGKNPPSYVFINVFLFHFNSLPTSTPTLPSCALRSCTCSARWTTMRSL